MEAPTGGRVTIDLDALASNWRLLRDRGAPAECGAVVKADAYGCGIERVVPVLARSGCRTFFTALPAEAAKVRKAAPHASIYVLNGLFDATTWFAQNNVRPVAGTLPDVERLRGTGQPFALHVDTGMTRLGLTVAEARKLDTSGLRIEMVMTHFACADDVDHPKTDSQREQLVQIAKRFPGARISVSNSAAILQGGDNRIDLVRPGIAMYGAEALNDVENPMRPVVTLEGRVVQVREAKRGDTVGYGATVTLTRKSRIAIVSVGYADGYHRSASGSGVPMRHERKGAHGFLRGRNVPVLGRVSMDLTAFDVTDVPGAVQGDWIEMFGANVAVDDVARACGTIGYELLTGLGNRYRRTYIDAS